MSKQANPAMIGAFVVGAVFLFITGIMIFSSGKWFHETKQFVVYFDESINGLVVGAPVKLNGVQIGQVIDIKVERDVKLKQMLAPVVFEIEPDKIINYNDIIDGKDAAVVLQELILDGLRMQLQVTSMLTGRLFIEARFLPETEVKLVRSSRNGLQEIPSVPSSVQEIQNTIKKVLADLQEIPLQQLFTELLDAVHAINQLTRSEQTQTTLLEFSRAVKDLREITYKINNNSDQAATDLLQTLQKAKHLMSTLDAQAGPLLQSSQQTINSANDTLIKMQATLATVDNVGNDITPVTQQLDATLSELSKAARSFRILMHYLERHPEALIQGKTDRGGG